MHTMVDLSSICYPDHAAWGNDPFAEPPSGVLLTKVPGEPDSPDFAQTGKFRNFLYQSGNARSFLMQFREHIAADVSAADEALEKVNAHQ